MATRKERGREVVRDMLGEQHAKKYDTLKSEEFGADLGLIALETAFGDIWSRPGLQRKQRSFVTMGALIALNHFDEFKHHVRAAVANGCTLSEIEEAIIHSAVYAGFPAAGRAMAAAKAVIAEYGLSK